MFHLTSIIAFLLLWTNFAQSENTDVCQVVLEDYTGCLLNTPATDFNSDDSIIDETACASCFTNNNFFEQYDATNCDDAASEICVFFRDCFDECFPKNSVCSENLLSYYTCAFASTYAPPSCMVTCQGIEGGDDSDIDTDGNPTSSGDPDDNGGKNRGSSTPTSAGCTTATMSVFLLSSVVASTFLVDAGRWL